MNEYDYERYKEQLRRQNARKKKWNYAGRGSGRAGERPIPGYLSLKDAIVEQAILDYVRGTENDRIDVRKFWRSDWFESLTGVAGYECMDILDRVYVTNARRMFDEGSKTWRKKNLERRRKLPGYDIIYEMSIPWYTVYCGAANPRRFDDFDEACNYFLEKAEEKGLTNHYHAGQYDDINREDVEFRKDRIFVIVERKGVVYACRGAVRMTRSVRPVTPRGKREDNTQE